MGSWESRLQSHVKQQAATTAVTSLDWLSTPNRWRRGKRRESHGKESTPAQLTKESNA
jgi:hypothetical protein